MMIKPLHSIAIISLTFFSILLLAACNNPEEETSLSKEKKEQQTPKSKKGNWTEEDAKKFMNDVSSSVPANIRALGDEAVEEILSCYLNKAILAYDGYDDANENKGECARLAYECVNELVGSEELYDEIPEDDISEEKVNVLTKDLEEILKDQLPDKK